MTPDELLGFWFYWATGGQIEILNLIHDVIAGPNKEDAETDSKSSHHWYFAIMSLIVFTVSMESDTDENTEEIKFHLHTICPHACSQAQPFQSLVLRPSSKLFQILQHGRVRNGRGAQLIRFRDGNLSRASTQENYCWAMLVICIP